MVSEGNRALGGEGASEGCCGLKTMEESSGHCQKVTLSFLGAGCKLREYGTKGEKGRLPKTTVDVASKFVIVDTSAISSRF